MFANSLYLFALVIASPWVLYRRWRHGRYRRGIRQKLLGISPQQAAALRGRVYSDTAMGRECESGLSRCLWIHAVSVGEVNLVGDIVRHLRRRYPNHSVVISTSTDTGYDQAVKKFGADRVFFCPLDFTWAVRRTIRNLDPELLVLAELELWPNLIKLARQSGTEVVVINGRLSDRSAAGYQRFRRCTQPIFESISHVECQDERSAKHFQSCGTPADRIAVSGSLKYDNAPESRDCVEVQSRMRWAGIDPWHAVWIVGSTQEGEERMALETYRRLVSEHSELRLVLVPRHPQRFEQVAKLIGDMGLKVHRRSCDESWHETHWDVGHVILIDTIGELRYWWGVGKIATVGGSFGDRGGQNMLEPAGYGNAVSFGPNTRNFADIANRLLDEGGAVRLADEQAMFEFVQRCLQDRPAAEALGRAARQVVEKHRGATQRTLERIETFVAPVQESERRVA